MNFKCKVLVMILCGLLMSGCMVSKAKLDEATAKIAVIESDVRSKDQEIISHDKEIASLEAANKALTSDVEKGKQLCNEEMAKARVMQEQVAAELVKVKGEVVGKEKEILSIKAEVVARDKELLLLKDEMAKKLLEKDKASEELIYSIREIQARTESLLEKIKSIR